MTFFEKYVCVFLKKSKANPESSMLSPEFSIKLKQKQTARQEKWRYGRLLDLSRVRVITRQTSEEKPYSRPRTRPTCSAPGSVVRRTGSAWPPVMGAESEGRVHLSPTIFIRCSVSVWGEFFPVLLRYNRHSSLFEFQVSSIKL